MSGQQEIINNLIKLNAGSEKTAVKSMELFHSFTWGFTRENFYKKLKQAVKGGRIKKFNQRYFCEIH